jgi:hypothetical protein
MSRPPRLHPSRGIPSHCRESRPRTRLRTSHDIDSCCPRGSRTGWRPRDCRPYRRCSRRRVSLRRRSWRWRGHRGCRSSSSPPSPGSRTRPPRCRTRIPRQPGQVSPRQRAPALVTDGPHSARAPSEGPYSLVLVQACLAGCPCRRASPMRSLLRQPDIWRRRLGDKPDDHGPSTARSGTVAGWEKASLAPTGPVWR